jgi:hypothetical protein
MPACRAIDFLAATRSRPIAAQEATDESRRRENVEKAEDILLDRVCGLSHDQRQEGRPAS